MWVADKLLAMSILRKCLREQSKKALSVEQVRTHARQIKTTDVRYTKMLDTFSMNAISYLCLVYVGTCTAKKLVNPIKSPMLYK